MPKALGTEENPSTIRYESDRFGSDVPDVLKLKGGGTRRRRTNERKELLK
jgi:hypothetical protein